MYNDSIKVANKIITYNDLLEIFTQMNEKLLYYKKIYDSEEKKNYMLSYKYQTWSFKDYNSRLTFDVNFYDDTQVKFDNFNNFISVFHNRLEEIKSIYASFYLSYSVESEGQGHKHFNQHIKMFIYEHKMDIQVSLSSEDKKIDDIYDLIKSKILAAPEKYDEIIKKKVSTTILVGLAIGLIPAFIITILLAFYPSIRQIYATGYVTYPMICLLLAFFIGTIISSFILDKYYRNIVPEQKYVGYDLNKGKTIYKDDINKYVTTSEILIGKNVHNLECRKQIKRYKDKCQSWIPYELGILILFSIIVLFLGRV